MNKYKEAGVDVVLGYEVVDKISSDVKKTYTKGVINNFGDFGALYDLSEVDVLNPVLVSGCDGVGTKLLIAIENNNYNYIGQDLVAMCVNDIITCGAKPLYFLDYIAVNKIDVSIVSEIVKSIAEACILAECSLVGGETAEMGNLYAKKHFDLAGFATGVVDKTKMVNKNNVTSGDVIIGLKSSGVHSNGYSLINKTMDISDERFLIPTKIYVREIMNLVKNISVKSMAHITGGGFYENIPRGLPNNMCAEININSIIIPDIFKEIQQKNNMSLDEMFHIFNMGIGFVVIVKESDVSATLALLEDAYVIGVVKECDIDEDSRICFR